MKTYQKAPQIRTYAYTYIRIYYNQKSLIEFIHHLYVALDRNYITREQFESARDVAEKTSRQIHRFMAYLETQPNVRRVKEDHVEYVF